MDGHAQQVRESVVFVIVAFILLFLMSQTHVGDMHIMSTVAHGQPQDIDDEGGVKDDEEHILNDTWTMYFHEPSDTDWTMSSYVRLDQISSVERFWQVHEGVRKYLSRGMFFLMREHVFPCWDDSSNIHGGCVSIKVLKEDICVFWQEAVTRLLGEKIMLAETSDAWSHVNGISTSPKRFFCICKLWLKDDVFIDRKHFDLPMRYHGEPLYRSNVENIRTSQAVVTTTPSRSSRQSA